MPGRRAARVSGELAGGLMGGRADWGVFTACVFNECTDVAHGGGAGKAEEEGGEGGGGGQRRRRH